MALRSVQHDNVREHNRFAVLQALRELESGTRAELARHTALSVPTVTTIVAELTALGVVADGDPVPSAGGRPARQHHLVANARNVLTLDLSSENLRAGRVDLLGALADQDEAAEVALGHGSDERLVAYVRQRISEESEAGNPISALAVAVPGVIDQHSGHVRLAPALGWSDEPVAQKLRAVTGLPVLLENDVNAVALGELLHGTAQGRRNVLYLSLGSGIGAALVIDGVLYRGANGAAGELGYSLLPGLSEAGLDLGASGPFERHLLGIAADFVRDGLVDLSTPERRQAFDTLSEKLRLALHNLACVLDPELIVVAWAADPEGELAHSLGDRWVAPLPVNIVTGSLGARAALHGVGHLALGRVTAGLCGLETGEWSTP